MTPPPVASSWPKAVLKRWFEDGGTLSLNSAEAMDEDNKSEMMQYVGIGLPVHTLGLTVDPTGGLLGAASRNETEIFDELGRQLTSCGFALADIGAPSASYWDVVCAEGRALWPEMTPGILTSREGVTTAGVDPSGNARGDRYLTSAAASALGDYPALRALDRACACLGTKLNDAAALQGILIVRSDPFFACFPGKGAQYGAHFDGGGAGDTTKLTMIVYTNNGWDAARDGGCLHLYDEAASDPKQRCWRSVAPLAGRIVLFRADHVLHKVMPTYRERFALTAWWMASPRAGERMPAGRMVTVDSTRDPYDPQRKRMFARDADGGTEREVLRSMSAACA